MYLKTKKNENEKHNLLDAKQTQYDEQKVRTKQKIIK